jgi:signal transduction histidine kinase
MVVKIEQLKPDWLKAVDVPRNGDSTLQLALEILADVKTLAHELYSPRLEILGTAEGCEASAETLGTEGRGDRFRPMGYSAAHRGTSLCLFRVLQEALHNAVKHRGVRQMDVQLSGTAEAIHLTVRNLGTGFTRKRQEWSRPWSKPYAGTPKLVKGSLTVDSRPGRGTKIYASVPLDSKIYSIV